MAANIAHLAETVRERGGLGVLAWRCAAGK
jgi:hypothetical protein